MSGGSAAPRGGEGEAPRFPCRAEAAFALPGGSLGSAGRGRSGGAVRGRAMPLPSYGFGHRGASRPPRSVPPGAAPTGRPWKGWECWWAASWAGASRVPRPRRTPAASLGCTNTITAQETEGRDCSPHSAFVRQYLSAAAGLGTAGIGNRPMRDEGPTGWWALEQLPGAERLREWGWLSRGQRRCRGQPAAPCQSLRGWASTTALTAGHGARLRDSERDWKRESGHAGNLFHHEKQERVKRRIRKGATLPLTPRRVQQQQRHRLPGELVQAPSVEVLGSRPDQAPSNPVRPRSCPGCEQEVALQPSSGLSQPGVPLPLRGERAAQQGPRGSRPRTLSGLTQAVKPQAGGDGEGPAAVAGRGQPGRALPAQRRGTGR